MYTPLWPRSFNRVLLLYSFCLALYVENLIRISLGRFNYRDVSMWFSVFYETSYDFKNLSMWPLRYYT